MGGWVGGLMVDCAPRGEGWGALVAPESVVLSDWLHLIFATGSEVDPDPDPISAEEWCRLSALGGAGVPSKRLPVKPRCEVIQRNGCL